MGSGISPSRRAGLTFGAMSESEAPQKDSRRKKKKLVNTWTDDQIQVRISEIESTLGSKNELSKSKRHLLYSKIAKLRKALKGECAVGGQKEAAKKMKISKKKIDKNRNRTEKDWNRKLTRTANRWKECLCCKWLIV